MNYQAEIIAALRREVTALEARVAELEAELDSCRNVLAEIGQRLKPLIPVVMAYLPPTAQEERG